MTDFPYAKVMSKFEVFLQEIRRVGLPKKATYKWLESIGYKSKNHRSFVKVLKFIGFVDSNSVPTDRWKNYRGIHYQQVLAEAIKDSYEELYATFPNAHERSEEELKNFFRSRTTFGEQVVKLTAKTFLTLSAHADFSSVETNKRDKSKTPRRETEEVSKAVAQAAPTLPAKQDAPVRDRSDELPSVHIDVQIHISPDSSAEQIDQIFASMAKHLYGNGGNE